jgi:hypothetical protein
VVAEEERVIDMMRRSEDPDEVIPTAPAKEFDLMALLAGATTGEPVPTVQLPSLFDSDPAFLDEALRHVFADPQTELDLRREEADPEFLSLVPPADLVRRLAALPQSYLAEQEITKRLKVTADPFVAERHLAEARRSTDSQWPTVGHLSPLHPFVDWLVDKVLVAIGRNEAPVILADVDQPTFCIQGMYSNGRGQPQLVEWMAVTETLGSTVVVDLFDALHRAGVTAAMPNSGRSIDLDALAARLPDAVAAARSELESRRGAHDARIEERLNEPQDRLKRWTHASHQLAFDFDERRRRERDDYTRAVRTDTETLIDSLRTAGQPMIRVLAVLVGRDR